MSLTKLDENDDKLSLNGRPRLSWEAEETLVEQRKKLRYRVRRWFGFWRTLLLLLVILAFLDAAMMRTIVNLVGSFVQTFLQMFSFDISTVIGRLLQILIFVTIGVGQLFVLFWFLGGTRMYTIWPGAATEGVSFADYRGQPELLEQAKQVVKLLRGVRVFEESGGEPLNGMLLEGPPGTGKTWLAQAISTEADVPFFYLDASSLQSMFFGVAPLKVSRLYRRARNAAKDYGAAIIFIDEIDAVGSRSGVSTTNNSEETQLFSRNRLPMFMGMGAGQGILSTLLVEMDGFSQEHGWWARKKRGFNRTIMGRKPSKPEKRVLTIGATNRMQVLDPALLRPGRFDKKIHVDAPDMEGRRDIFEYYLSKMAHDESMDPLILASETPGYTPAAIKYLLNESLRYAMFDGRGYATYGDYMRARPEHEMGVRQPIKNLSREDKYRLAAHEAGHAIAIRLFTPDMRISRITIIRQGRAHGHVSWQPAVEEYDYMGTYDRLLNRLRVSVAGKAGEMEFVGEHAQTLGVYGDFGTIRSVLWDMAYAGMFGPLWANFQGANYPPELAEAMEETFKMVLEDMRVALRIHREMGEALIALLIEKDELLAREVEEFFDQYGLYTPKVQLHRADDELASRPPE